MLFFKKNTLLQFNNEYQKLSRQRHRVCIKELRFCERLFSEGKLM
jgi:hypothetical protein